MRSKENNNILFKAAISRKGREKVIIIYYSTRDETATQSSLSGDPSCRFGCSPPSPRKITALNNILLFSLLFITLLLYHKPLLLIRKHFFSFPRETKTLSRFTSHHEQCFSSQALPIYLFIVNHKHYSGRHSNYLLTLVAIQLNSQLI